MKQPPPTTSVDSVPTTFEVGRHTVVVRLQQQHRWVVSVDAEPLAATFGTQADAWEAGVREAARLDGPRRPPGDG